VHASSGGAVLGNGNGNRKESLDEDSASVKSSSSTGGSVSARSARPSEVLVGEETDEPWTGVLHHIERVREA